MGVSTAVAVTVAGGLYSAYSQNKAGKRNAQTAEFNAKVAEVQAVDAINRGKQDAQDSWHRTQQFAGAQRAAAAGQNVVVDQDSVGALVDQTHLLGQRDIDTIRYNAAMEAWGYHVEGKDASLRGNIAKKTATNQAYSTLLTTGAQAYYQNQQPRSGNYFTNYVSPNAKERGG